MTPNSPSLRQTAAALAALAAAPCLLRAYPINDAVMYGSGAHGAVVDGRCVAGNLDADPELEVFGGGNWIAHPTGYRVSPNAGPHTHTPLPEPNRSPYGIQHPINWGECSGDIADVDHDGDLDLVRAVEMYYDFHAENRHVLAVYLNNGAGAFTIGWQKTFEGESIASVRCGDFDRDGDADIAQVTPGSVRIHWNGGLASGQFAASTVVAGRTGFACQVEVLDADRDGWTDLAWFNYENDAYRLVIARNDGDTTFTLQKSFSTTAMPRQLAAHDVDRDGWTDLVAAATVANYNGGVLNQTGLVSWSRNEGNGFGAPTPIAVANGTALGCFSFADLDEDGDADLLYITDGGVEIDDHFWIAYRTTGTTFDVPKQMGPHAPLAPGLVTADVDVDGDADLCSLSGFNNIQWFQNRAIHPAAAASVIAHSGPALAGRAELTTGDLDNDGVPDLIVACPEEKRLLWYEGGTSSLPGPIFVGTSNLAPSSAAAGDFDRDGDVDLAYTVQGSATVYGALSFNGAGTTFTTSPVATMSGVAQVRAADADRDGDDDLLAVSPAAGVVRWYKNDGSGTTWLPENVATGLAQPLAAEAIQSVPGSRPEVSVRLGSSLRLFQATPSWQPRGENYTPGESLACADLDLDGRTDLLSSDLLGAVYWCRHDGTALQPASIGSVGGPVRSLAAVDWNRDGRPDALCAWSGGLTLFTNHPSGWTAVPLATGADYGAVVPFRLNSDERPDAVAQNLTTGKLALIINTSWEVSIDQADAAVTPAASLRPGQTGPVIRMRVTNPGGGYDDRLFPSSLKVRLLKAAGSGRPYTPGTPLSQVEIDELIASVAVFNESFEEVGRTQDTVLSNGFLSVNQTFAGSVGVPTGRSRDLLLTLTLKPGAASAANQRFFVEHRAIPLLSPGSTWAYGPGATRTLRAVSPTPVHSSLVEITALAPLPAWRKAWWNLTASTGVAANHADPDADGVPNLIEYVTGTNPTRAEPDLNAARALTMEPRTHAELTGGANLPLGFILGYYWDDSVTVELQQSADLKNWEPLATRHGRQPWTGLLPETATANPDGTALRVMNSGVDGHPARRLFRLRAIEVP